MANRKRSCAIVGTGRIGRFYGELLRDSAHFEIAAQCDPDASAGAVPIVPGCRIYANLDTLLAHECIDVAVICAPPDRHFDLITRCLERGVHLLCEKPLAPHSVQCAATAQALRGRDVRLALSSKFRYVPAIVEARQLLRRGALGSLRRVVIDFSTTLDIAGSWRAEAARGGGVLLDNGPHAADLNEFLFGHLGAIEACRLTSDGPDAVDHAARLHLRYDNGARGEIRLSWRAEPARRYLFIEGSAATLEVGWQQSTLRYGATMSPIQLGGYDKHAVFGRMLDDLVAFIDRRPSELADLPSACRQLGWIESARRAAHLNDLPERGNARRATPRPRMAVGI